VDGSHHVIVAVQLTNQRNHRFSERFAVNPFTKTLVGLLSHGQFLPTCRGREKGLHYAVAPQLGQLQRARVCSRFVAIRVAAPNIARQGAGLGNGHSLAKSRNAAWRYLARNPEGRACFCARRRFSSLVWNAKLRSSCLASRKNR